ncbi:MAG: indole-3-glycerol phosphate synthase TrpC [Desulfobacula sp.]|jgi:indole-3-glycerol phosphate synthase|uniref:indole-3-glycerol phosphate synthase TrpC n=1 Tax=Desulfobacula sp. TaxID=2593537 RepID=UPI001DB32F30|nr:indole-3-glycerol phosphate synthase TrpC [Desulfobacula sp.]MBT3483851.1 indole-3-glycerol phosphate synthase TrpC [Desulfobacula sp.]MBT3803039.1 indole-3-glycerol phosphate synthase TrpC [Desulfobacula sp.]MBT4023448.1 indole-3-glycerol phosphate synthase TrpC [Desulfobacula sp.]MBT4197087.1 indole-3-glycerol phosphate synthase TrpC [Desulfobacula sp.]
MEKNFLSIIVDHKKQEVALAKKHISENQLMKRAAKRDGKRPFLENLKRYNGVNTVNIIAEIKRASPSKGDIDINLNPETLAKEYEKGGACALSVLTETKYFKGSFDDFKKTRDVSSLPMLRKDFMISAYQLYESCVLNADAVLLIARILSKTQLKDYLDLSAELNLDALVEINSEKDLESANDAGAKLIGINNRNLSSFDTDIKTAMRLACLLDSDQIAVAASGITSKDDIIKNQSFGIYNFLIGESLVKAESTTDFLKSLYSL